MSVRKLRNLHPAFAALTLAVMVLLSVLPAGTCVREVLGGGRCCKLPASVALNAQVRPCCAKHAAEALRAQSGEAVLSSSVASGSPVEPTSCLATPEHIGAAQFRGQPRIADDLPMVAYVLPEINSSRMLFQPVLGARAWSLDDSFAPVEPRQSSSILRI